MLEEDMPGVDAVAEAVNRVLDEVGYGYYLLSPACRADLRKTQKRLAKEAMKVG